MIFALASAAMLDRKSAVGSPFVSTYAAVQGTPAELTSGAPPPYRMESVWLSPPWKTSRISSPCSRVPSAIFALTPLLSIATILPITSRWLSSSVAMSSSMSFRFGSSSPIACVKYRIAAASSPSGPPNCSSIRLASRGLGSETRTVYINRLLWTNIEQLLRDNSTKPQKLEHAIGVTASADRRADTTRSPARTLHPRGYAAYHSYECDSL